MLSQPAKSARKTRFWLVVEQIITRAHQALLLSRLFKMSGLAEGRKPDDHNLDALNSFIDSKKDDKYALTLMWLTDELEEEAEAA